MPASSSNQGWKITEEEREVYRKRSQASSRAKAQALRGEGIKPIHPINTPQINPEQLMPQLVGNGLRSLSFGIPQLRKRVFFVGFQDEKIAAKYQPPQPTHCWHHLPTNNTNQSIPSVQLELFFLLYQAENLQPCMGTREALGLPNIGFDALSPTIRSSLTGPRHTTSILSSVSAQKAWERMKIWPNGVAPNRERAHLFVPENGHFRLSVPDCAILQGFPDSWPIYGAVYMALGQIGNAVPPPMAYRVAVSVAQALS